MVRLLIVAVFAGLGCSTPAQPPDAGEVDGGPCGASTCASGCCDAQGACQPGAGASACGRNGEACADCTPGWCSSTRTCGGGDGGCFAEPVPGAAWETGTCPDAGCPAGSHCLRGTGESGNEFGCVPVAASCQGAAPTCACMGCVCALGCFDSASGLSCFNGTISRRAFKDDVVYLSDAERAAVAREALQIPLARYRYGQEPPTARRRLGFLIDDQPNPSPAVMDDRLHVDEYGYTSMVLATLQQQARELAELRQRLEALERTKGCAR